MQGSCYVVRRSKSNSTGAQTANWCGDSSHPIPPTRRAIARFIVSDKRQRFLHLFFPLGIYGFHALFRRHENEAGIYWNGKCK